MLVPFALLLVAAAAAIADWRTGEIPNWLTLPAMGAAVILHGVLGGKAGLADSVLGLIGCGLVPYLMFRWNAIGGGDVKLFAALGAIGGLALGIEAQMFGMMFALVAGVVLTLRQGSLRQTPGQHLPAAGPRRRRAPLAPADADDVDSPGGVDSRRIDRRRRGSAMTFARLHRPAHDHLAQTRSGRFRGR